MNKKLDFEMIFRKVGIDVDSIKKEELKQFEMNGSIIDVQKSMFIDFFGLHIIDYLC